MVIKPKPGTYAFVLSCASNGRIQVGGAWERCSFSAGITFTWGARWGLVACVPGSCTIKSCPHYRTGTSTTCERTPRFIAFGLATMRDDMSTNGPAWCKR